LFVAWLFSFCLFIEKTHAQAGSKDEKTNNKTIISLFALFS
jgi:hypothetical protein